MFGLRKPLHEQGRRFRSFLRCKSRFGPGAMGSRVSFLIDSRRIVSLERSRLVGARKLSRRYGGTGSARFTDYSGDPEPCGWIVSPRANISMNFSMRLARVSIFFALPIR
jgi:hypothetical protein